MLLDCGCWRRLLRVPWTPRRSNQSILKEISPEYSLEWLMLKLKLQYFGHLMQRTNSFEKTLMLGKIEVGKDWKGDDRGWDGWMASPTQWTWVWVNSRMMVRWWTGRPGVLWSMGLQRVGYNWTTELNWSEGEVTESQGGCVQLGSHLCLNMTEEHYQICMGSERIPHSVLSGNSDKTGRWIKIKNTGVKKDRE